MYLCVHAHTWSLLHKHQGFYQTTEQKHQNPQHERLLLFSSTNTCSGGLHRWGGHRDRATLTNSQHSSSGKGTCKQQVKSPVGTGDSTKHQSSLARPSCFSHLFLRCFPPGFLKHYLPLAALTNKWCSKRKTGGLDVSLFPSCLHKRHFRMQFACKRWPWLRRRAGESRQLGHPMATLSYSLHFFHPCLAYTRIWCYSRRGALSATSQLRLWSPEHNTGGINLHRGAARQRFGPGRGHGSLRGLILTQPSQLLLQGKRQMVCLCSHFPNLQDSLACLWFLSTPPWPHWSDRGTNPSVNQQALTSDVVYQIPSLYFNEVSGRRFRSKTFTHNSCRLFVSNNVSNLYYHIRNEKNTAISHQQ